MAPGENNKTTMDLESTPNESCAAERSGPVKGCAAAGADDDVEDSLALPEDSTTKSTSQPETAVSQLPDEYSDEPDETLAERLWGLTEMFPDSVRNGFYNVVIKTADGLKAGYGLSRNVVWIFVSSSVILFAPLIFEVERAQMEDMQRTQQKQMLLGPNTAVSGQGVPMPPIHR